MLISCGFSSDESGRVSGMVTVSCVVEGAGIDGVNTLGDLFVTVGAG